MIEAAPATRGQEPPRPGRWMLLSYRLPREPSTPRIALWRRLKRLGVAQLGDGLVALPLDARTREQMEWVADEVRLHGGQAAVWLAEPGSAAQERQVAAELATVRAEEYGELIVDAEAALTLPPAQQVRVLARLRRELRAIRRRDYFPPAERDKAQAAVAALADVLHIGDEPAPSLTESSEAKLP